MSKNQRKIDHIGQAVNETRKKTLGIKDAVADRVLAILNEHSGVDLKRSEVQAAAKDLVELQTVSTNDQHEKQD